MNPTEIVTPELSQTAPIGKDFILAGAAIFTLQGRTSRFTFRVTRQDPEPGSRYTTPTYFVGLLTGSDNNSDYSYLGILDARTGALRLTKASKATDQAPSVIAFRWAMPIVWTGKALPAPAQVHHEGRCGRCGRRLTVPESITSGIGPDCAGKMNLGAAVAPQAAPRTNEPGLVGLAAQFAHSDSVDRADAFYSARLGY